MQAGSRYWLIEAESRGSVLEDVDVQAVMSAIGVDPVGFCDRFARMTAELYLAGTMSFDEADGAINALHAYVCSGPWEMDLLPEFSWQVYLAFDAGEFDHGVPRRDPIAELTNPRLKKLLARG